MSSVDVILSPIKNEMAEFEVRFKDSMQSDVSLLEKINHYIIKRKGKQVRPMFVFLCAKMLGENADKTYDAAILIELLHTATLVHDDVVDDANERRGSFSVNAIWKNKIAVLVGDFMLSKILLLSLEKENTELLKIIARSVKDMSEGELLQIEKARLLDITEDIYYDVIKKKTASLISSCCEIGAASVNADEEMRKKMKDFGEKVGLAFQIKDDIFDYGDGTNIGKPTGTDIRERKLTLPIIYVLNNCSKEIRKELINIIKNHNESKKHINRAIDIVIKNGGIDYANKQMNLFAEKALNLLTEIPSSEYKIALLELVKYTINRKK